MSLHLKRQVDQWKFKTYKWEKQEYFSKSNQRFWNDDLEKVNALPVEKCFKETGKPDHVVDIMDSMNTQIVSKREMVPTEHKLNLNGHSWKTTVRNINISQPKVIPHQGFQGQLNDLVIENWTIDQHI